MDPILRFWIIVASLFLASILFFFLSGFCYVKQNHLALKKDKNGYQEVASGWHYFFPFSTRVYKARNVRPLVYRTYQHNQLTLCVIVLADLKLASIKKANPVELAISSDDMNLLAKQLNEVGYRLEA